MIHTMRNRLIAAVLLSSALFAAVPARAADIAPYEDRDSNALKVAYYFVYPVGKTLEFLVFRPLHTISALTQPDPDQFRAEQHESNPTGWITRRPSRIEGRGQ
jgi:hypothetical protein